MYKNVCFSITEEQNDWLEIQKKKLNISKSLMVRQAIELIQNNYLLKSSNNLYSNKVLPAEYNLINKSLYNVDDMRKIE